MPDVDVLARQRAAKQAAQQGRGTFEALALHAGLGSRQALAQLSGAVDEARHHYTERAFHAARLLAAQRATYAALADDTLEADEEEHLAHMLERLGLTFDDLRASDAELWTDLAVARINAGRLPIEPDPSEMLSHGEVAHGSFDVALVQQGATSGTGRGNRPAPASPSASEPGTARAHPAIAARRAVRSRPPPPPAHSPSHRLGHCSPVRRSSSSATTSSSGWRNSATGSVSRSRTATPRPCSSSPPARCRRSPQR